MPDAFNKGPTVTILILLYEKIEGLLVSPKEKNTWKQRLVSFQCPSIQFFVVLDLLLEFSTTFHIFQIPV